MPPLCLPAPCSKGESYVTLLNFVTGQSNAAAQGTAIALGTYHTVGLFCRPDAPAPEYCMYSMGRGFHGQLGLEHFDNQHEPQRVRLGLRICMLLLCPRGGQVQRALLLAWFCSVRSTCGHLRLCHSC